jgi:hypothetical protein
MLLLLLSIVTGFAIRTSMPLKERTRMTNAATSFQAVPSNNRLLRDLFHSSPFFGPRKTISGPLHPPNAASAGICTSLTDIRSFFDDKASNGQQLIVEVGVTAIRRKHIKWALTGPKHMETLK